jgi:phage terminase large subunit-like protein
MKRKEITFMWVDTEFKKMLKHKAVEEGVTLTDLTKSITDVTIDPFKKDKRRYQ